MRISRRLSMGPWGLRGYQIRANGGLGPHVATCQVTTTDGYAIAAVPDLINRLLLACDKLDDAEPHPKSHSGADDIRLWLLRAGLADHDDGDCIPWSTASGRPCECRLCRDATPEDTRKEGAE